MIVGNYFKLSWMAIMLTEIQGFANILNPKYRLRKQWIWELIFVSKKITLTEFF